MGKIYIADPESLFYGPSSTKDPECKIEMEEGTFLNSFYEGTIIPYQKHIDSIKKKKIIYQYPL